MNEIQHETKAFLRRLIDIYLKDDVLLSLGFGSFWQNYDGLNSSSDIDFFVLLNSLPTMGSLLSFSNELSGYKITPFPLSCHIFVGAIDDLLISEDNVMRLLNIYAPPKKRPVILYGRDDIDLLVKFKNYNTEIRTILRANLFRTTRFFLYEFVSTQGNPTQEALLEKYKQAKRFQECFEYANTRFWGHNETGICRLLKDAIDEVERNSVKTFRTHDIYDLFSKYCKIVLSEDWNGKACCDNRC